jgi:L-lactate dehydrogenase complex protein LldG
MSEAREEILRRIRSAIVDVSAEERPEDVPVVRAYRSESPLPADELVGLLVKRLREYGTTAKVVTAQGLSDGISGACDELGLGRLVVPRELDHAWRPSRVELVEDRGLPIGELERIDGALTGCVAAIAESGTLVLDGRAACGRRAVSLLPDNHICVVEERQIVGMLPEAIARLTSAAREGAAITLISGPSATSDIELKRVEGVHGPRRLHVLIVR